MYYMYMLIHVNAFEILSLLYFYTDYRKQILNSIQTLNVNQLLFATTLFRDLPEINWFTKTIFHDHTRFDITLIRQRQVCGEKYLRRRGFSKYRKYFSTVYSILVQVEIIYC